MPRQNVGFQVPDDGEWTQLDVYPGWSGKISRLRIDPPGNEPGLELRIKRLAIYEWPETEQTGPIRDLTRDHGDWLPRGGANLSMGPAGMRVEGPAPMLTYVPETQPAAEAWVTLEAQADGPGVCIASWTDADGKPQSLSQAFTAGRTRYALRFADSGPPPVADEALRVSFTFRDGAGSVLVRQAALADGPVGSAQLDLLSASIDRAFATTGEPAQLVVQLQNSGGEALPAGEVPVSGDARATIAHGALGPGERATVRAAIPVEAPGTHQLTVGPPEAEVEITLSVSAAPDRDPGPGARVTTGTASLVGERIRLLGGASTDGAHGPLWLEVQDGDEWRSVATLSAIGEVRTTPDARTVMDTGHAKAQSKALSFSSSFEDDEGRTWRASATYRLASPDRVAVEHKLTVDAAAELYHFSGPWLRVGDGTTGAGKFEALFPGIEYLGTDVAEQEASSSDRDIWAPQDLRMAPDRHKITIPLQAITLPNRDLVALLWNNEPDGSGPAAVFASPNFLEGGDQRLPNSPRRSGENHLLGLYWPPVPEFADENSLIAGEPFPVRAGRPVVIRSQILARPGGQVLDAVEEWRSIYKPKPAGRVAELEEQTLRLSRDFYQEEYGAKQQDAAGIAVQCLHLAHLLNDPAMRELAEAAPGSSDVARALHAGSVADALWNASAGGQDGLAGREEDGSWVFRPDEARADLGDTGDTNAGIIAPPLGAVLRNARATADEAMLAEALESLEHLRKYRVPRGAQVWEVPLHCPDILASGRACDAFRLAYELTGDEEYLEDAQYWARTALPFIYHWQHPREDLKPMRGGSIPVFGASAFTNSWFGRLVQWNGLAVARSLHALWRAGGGEEWGQVAEDLTVSGQRQQITDPENADYGRYPDYWNMRTGIPGYWLSPGLLLTTVLERSGHTPGGDWLALRSDGQLVTIGSPTPLVNPKAGDKALSRVATDVDGPFNLAFTVDYPLGPQSHVVVSGVAQPASVRIGKQDCDSVDDLDQAAEGWQYSEDFAAVIIKVDHSGGPRAVVEVAGLSATDSERLIDRRVWSFVEGLRGWGFAPHDVRIERTDSRLVATATGGDPYFSGPLVSIPTDTIERIVIRAKATAPGSFQVFWGLGDAGNLPERSAATEPIPADGQFHDAVLTLSAHAEWKGTLRRLRLDPPGGEGSVTEIESIRLEP